MLKVPLEQAAAESQYPLLASRQGGIRRDRFGHDDHGRLVHNGARWRSAIFRVSEACIRVSERVSTTVRGVGLGRRFCNLRAV